MTYSNTLTWMYMLDTCLTHRHLYLFTYTYAYFHFSPNTPTHMSSLYFLHTNARATKHFPIKGVPTYKHMKPFTLSPSPQFFRYLFFFFFSQRPFIEDQTNGRYLHPLGLFSHSTVLLWYWRADKGTLSLSLSDSLRERSFHLDRCLSSNVTQERPTCPFGDWCAVGDDKDKWRTPEILYYIFRILWKSLMPFLDSSQSEGQIQREVWQWPYVVQYVPWPSSHRRVCILRCKTWVYQWFGVETALLMPLCTKGLYYM